MMSLRARRAAAGVTATIALAGVASAQFGNEWTTFNRDQSKLGPSGTSISNSNNEVDFAWADLDQDGWTDLVIVRKKPFTNATGRTNLLLMNESGVLVDRTSAYASASDVAGDQGFQETTNDRDVVIVDVDNDGWLDVVTAPTLSDGQPKHIGHPRVYMNLGDQGGMWQGLEHQDARIPQLFHFGNGSAQNPRFCSVGAADLTGDGYADLYFGDYDSGPGSSSSNDLNDRLLINDGNGFFSDQSQSRMTSTMLKSAFGTSVELHDYNLDGVVDIMKDTALNAPQYVAISYNDPSNEGFFNLFDDFHSFAPYFIETGDLNNDGRRDVVVVDDGADRIRFNDSNDVFGRVQWSGAKTFQFLAGNDDGFGGNALITDLDQDGWNDVIITDADVDIPGCGRRTHFYHNLGGTPGSYVTLREEREKSGSGGWLGVKGLKDPDLEGTHDVAVFDVDGDGDLDMILGRCTGTDFWRNDSVPATCQTSIGFAGPGDARMTLCGGDLSTGTTAELRIENLVPLTPTFIAFSAAVNPTPLFGGTIVTIPALVVVEVSANDNGNVVLPGFPGGGGPATIFAQALGFDPNEAGLFEISDALKIDLLP